MNNSIKCYQIEYEVFIHEEKMKNHLTTESNVDYITNCLVQQVADSIDFCRS